MGAPKTNATKPTAKLVSVDERGRVTLPSEARAGIDTFSVEIMKDGTIKLIPQKVVNIADATLLKSLKKSVAQAKREQVEDIPDEWLGD
jgi:bifunctional DNA-binding transcriptional regulator/antitoxin component of YhaV-PrlF toxin-antitoxin module